MQAPSSAPRRFNPWPLSIVVFFTVAIAGCVGMVAFCSRHPADLVAADYYEQELRYQSQIDRQRHAQERAQLAKVAYDASAKLITISLPPNQSRANATGNIQLYRPSAGSLDRQIQLEPNAAGVQTIDASTLAPGLWKVHVSWTADQQDYFLDQRLTL
jgi:nitrogen fixation protein FixH